MRLGSARKEKAQSKCSVLNQDPQDQEVGLTRKAHSKARHYEWGPKKWQMGRLDPQGMQTLGLSATEKRASMDTNV